MSAHMVYTCDICGKAQAAAPITTAGAEVKIPSGWCQKQFEDRLDHCCGECIAAFASFKAARISARVASEAKAKPRVKK